jgi:DNA uptake protein ComE-like DNA-binding protein
MNWLKKKQIREFLKQNPYHRLSSALEVSIAADLGLKIDANRATVDEWLRLSIFSIHQARTLVELSRQNVQFLSLEDIATAVNISLNQIKPFESVIYFAYYSALTPISVNINQASIEQLSKVHCIGQDLAVAIVNERQRAGKYSSVANFQSRLSLDGELMSQLSYYLYC